MKWMAVDEPTGLDALRLAEVATPEPGPGQVRVRIAACGVNFADTLMVKGQYQVRPEPPFAPGIEIAGRVDALGAGVTQLREGQPVAAIVGHGGLAEQAVLDARLALPLPETMDLVEAAAFPVAYGTSHIGLDHRAGLRAGETLVVHGAGGGVGLTAVEIGKRLGARVIATAGSQAKLDAARAKGADLTIDYASEDVRQAIKDATDGRGADVIYDPVGGAAFDASLRAIAFEGRIVVVGFASGTIPQIPANILLVKNVSAVGLHWGLYADKRPEVLVRSLQTLMGWYAAGEIRPHVSATYPLADAGRALADLAERRATGKVVVTMG
ncbi:NADPH2:quinone reductase [Rhodothalassium salexigens DSM 2132]|uniref:NADPH2:quinone reductase n=1 Tax=Rhodothalassium salexigens DSM 2132 TaxID=1188247 RepID=A0A4R2PEF0_RHOSA|nr:NADPH:quinone oxidoreductase family protein [Rhodothalassium salexigens]MBB4211909.1 NADPH2:quinone reductase [Rhodothalassium salexigens DSM 2132]MBK1639824.1 zinc-binding dehydrogenase [Rhodothalassium salexigens DSM 2132]TCP33507.1 NADPH2:quinone reductase [Rhodothalassium salexigens DSM 2132]